ncbi:MAG: sensor histidine kinase [Nocardioidaceae bacterium]
MDKPAQDLGELRGRRAGVVGPLALAVVQIVGTLGAAHRQQGRALDVLAFALLLAGPAALLLVRRAPVPVLWFVTAVTLGYLVRDYPFGPFIFSMVVAVITAVVLKHRLAAVAAMVALVCGHFVIHGLILNGGWSWPLVLGVSAWALVVLFVAEVIRGRQDRVAASRRERAETQRRQANEERLRIARELHDVVAHHMSLINVQAGVALHLMDRRPEQAQTALAAIKDASREALTELRSLVGVLRDEDEAAPRAPVTRLDGLDELVRRSGQAGLDVRQRVTGTPRPLPVAVDLAAFRVVQEAITNVVRHSGARRADLWLDYGDEVLGVQVDDDGRGIPDRALAEAEGNGIRGMRERAHALRGELTVGKSPSGGARVTLRLPTAVDE